MKTQPVNLFIAVCHDFHSARGPWLTAEECVAQCRRLTKESSSRCVYLPVVLKTEGAVMSEESAVIEAGSSLSSDTSREQSVYPGQYL